LEQLYQSYPGTLKAGGSNAGGKVDVEVAGAAVDFEVHPERFLVCIMGDTAPSDERVLGHSDRSPSAASTL